MVSQPGGSLSVRAFHPSYLGTSRSLEEWEDRLFQLTTTTTTTTIITTTTTTTTSRGRLPQEAPTPANVAQDRFCKQADDNKPRQPSAGLRPRLWYRWCSVLASRARPRLPSLLDRTSDTMIDVSPVSMLGLSRPPDTAMPKPILESFGGEKENIGEHGAVGQDATHNTSCIGLNRI
ncbi:hypothetical protein EYF80_022091 [Liparis tanakae]|uniref:Uncharacterized protein n=1 Tax=Liparis tanakae TaxID=230148 RepID=A0A4Z2HPC4_9TELE|nr:hypothetical protein EYF80_022091 [Liparis tanakae]